MKSTCLALNCLVPLPPGLTFHQYESSLISAVYFRHELAKMLSETSWGNKSRRHFLSREQEYVEALKAALGIW